MEKPDAPTLAGSIISIFKEAFLRLATGYRHAFDPQCRGVDAVFDFQIIGGAQVREHIVQVAGNGDLADRVGDFAIFDPETTGPARIVAGHAIDAKTDQFIHEQALLYVGHQFFRACVAGFQV